MAVTASAVKDYAVAHGLTLSQPATLRDAAAQALLRTVDVDVLAVAAYGLILPQAVLDWPRYGCLNVHASLLPRWRGAAPIARAIEAGDAMTGITIMQMDAGLDTGPVVASAAIPLAARETAGTLQDRLAAEGARLNVEVLATLERHRRLITTPQPAQGATYAPKIERNDRLVRWSADAAQIDRKVRALAPAPTAVAGWRGQTFQILAAEPVDGPETLGLGGDDRSDVEDVFDAECGRVMAVDRAGIDVRCGGGTRLRLTELRPAGGRTMAASAFAAGRGLRTGERLENGA
jgi:methionyl-tRNA formyltransferase